MGWEGCLNFASPTKLFPAGIIIAIRGWLFFTMTAICLRLLLGRTKCTAICFWFLVNYFGKLMLHNTNQSHQLSNFPLPLHCKFHFCLKISENLLQYRFPKRRKLIYMLLRRRIYLNLNLPTTAFLLKISFWLLAGVTARVDSKQMLD